jgi:outer membrane lipoprotein-sorting protein
MLRSSRSSLRTWLPFAIASSWPLSAPAVESPLADPEITACLERALPANDMEQTLGLRVYDATGSVSESRARLYWQRGADDRARFLIRLIAPPMRTGIAILAVEGTRAEPDVFLYLPELRQTRRVAGRTFSGSMLGTDFSYEDYLQFQGIREASATRRLDDAVLDGHPAYVIETVPAAARSAYSRILTWLDRTSCMILRSEFFGRDGELAKELVVDRASVREVDGRPVPVQVVMHDRRQDTRTELMVEEIAFDAGLSENLFKPSTLAHP